MARTIFHLEDPHPDSSHFSKSDANPSSSSHIDSKVDILIPVRPTSSHFAKRDANASTRITSDRNPTFHPTSSRGGMGVFKLHQQGSSKQKIANSIKTPHTSRGC